MSEHARVLDGSGIGPLVAGGKGSALDRLVALDARVPRTGVVTTSAYIAFEQTPTIASFVAELKSSPVPDPVEHHEARRRVDEMFLSVPLPSDVADAVAALTETVSGDGLVAVRSSATAEDLASASFAGQYESYLNVDADGVHDALRLVWASLWYPAPRAYRRFRQIPEHDLTMAVVVMQMLEPSEAGVLFTVDPGGGDDAARLEVVQGLGEQLVSGETTPDAYVIDRAAMHREFAAISPPLGELATEALRLEAALDAPQDIEFAVHDGELYLVQARPITTVADASRTDDGFDFSCGEETTYTTAGIAEMLPGVLPPLLWGVNSWLLENGFRYLFDLLGGGADVLTQEHALVGRFRGRAALNLDAMSDAAGSIPGGSPEELQRQYFGDAVPDDAVGSGHAGAPLTRSAGAAQGIRVLRARRKAVEESEIVIQAVDNLMEDEPSLVRMSDGELLAYWNRLLYLAQRVAAVEVAVAAMASAAYRSVEVFLEKHLPDDDAATAARELTTIDRLDRRSHIALALDDIAAQIKADPDLLELAADDWDEARAGFEATVPGRRLVLDFFEALRRAGSTGLFAGPTWDEVPGLAWLTIVTTLRKPTHEPAADRRRTATIDLEARITSTAKWRWTRFVTGQLMDVRRRFLRREAEDAAELLHRRERTKAALLVLGGVVRHAHQEFGVRLHERGELENPEDVELLSVGEVRMLVGGDGPSLETLAMRRRRNIEAAQGEPLPLVWTGTPPEATAPEVAGERFEGWSASPGRYEGRACIVESPTTANLRRGDVLVATTTDASWAPLFMTAGAVIVEHGGPLSHAAIVARELGMPAVANVPGLIGRLRGEGEPPMLTVDGSDGVVVIHTTDGDQTPDATRSGSDAVVAAVAPVAPVRRPDPKWEDGSSSFNVFVAGLMGAGAIMSVLVGLTESISSARGRERLHRRAAPVAAMMSQATIHGFDNVLARETGLRPRRDYAMAAIGLFATAAVLLATSLDSYLSEATGSVVAFALSATGVATLTAAASTLGIAAQRWPDVPPVVRRLAPGRPPRTESVWASVSSPARIAIASMVGLVALGGVLAVVAEDALLAIDEPIYSDWLEAGEDADRWGPDFLNRLGQPIVIIPLAALIGLLTLRVRIVALAWPLAVIGGGLTNLVLSWVVHRERPLLSAHAGEFTSYPGGHSIQLTLLLGMVPLTAQVVARSRRAGVIAAAIAAPIWVVAWLDTVRTGGHWPIDQVAGLLIAISLLTIVYSTAWRDREANGWDRTAG